MASTSISNRDTLRIDDMLLMTRETSCLMPSERVAILNAFRARSVLHGMHAAIKQCYNFCLDSNATGWQRGRQPLNQGPGLVGGKGAKHLIYLNILSSEPSTVMRNKDIKTINASILLLFDCQ